MPSLRAIGQREERDVWVWQRVNCIYDAMVAAGMDPTIPEEGIEFLTEEQAREKMFRQYLGFFSAYVVQAHVAELLSGKTMETICEEGLEKLAKENNMSVEDIRSNSNDSMIYGKFAQEAAMELLSQYAEQFLEA